MRLPSYSSLKQHEGSGNYAIKPYYRFPKRFFYRHKLKMIVDMMRPGLYRNIMDFGAGPGIFTPELQRHGLWVTKIDHLTIINPLWRFDLIVCASVLEFCELDFTLKMLKGLLAFKGEIIIASPMQTKLSKLYFQIIKDKNTRHSHQKILDRFSHYFRVEKYKEWLGLYFAMKGMAI